MFRFTRTATVKNAADLPAAIKFATEVCGYLNKVYSLNLRSGVELFGSATLHWQFETESLDKITALNAKLMEDRQYLGILEKVKDIWVEGSLEDTSFRPLASRVSAGIRHPASGRVVAIWCISGADQRTQSRRPRNARLLPESFQGLLSRGDRI